MKRKPRTPKTSKKPVRVYGDLGPTYDERVFGRLTPTHRDAIDASYIVMNLSDTDRKHVMIILRSFALLYLERDREGGAK